MEFKCGNCKFAKDAKEIDTQWAGIVCTKIAIMESTHWDGAAYIVHVDGREVFVIVNENFLCKLWEPKEGK